MSFCWGAYPAVHAAALAPPAAGLPITSNIMFHPSFDNVATSLCEDRETLVKAAGRVPTSVYATSMEPKSWQPEGQVHSWMRESAKTTASVVRWQSVGQMHGFVTRGDMKGNLALAKDVQRVLEEAIVFLNEQTK